MKFIRKVFWLFTLAILILAVLPINGPNNPMNNTYLVYIRTDYLIHASIFAAWILLYKIAFLPSRGFFTLHHLLPLALIVSLLAVISEFAQLITPYRSFNFNDLIANFLGIFLGFGLLGLMALKNKRFHQFNKR